MSKNWRPILPCYISGLSHSVWGCFSIENRNQNNLLCAIVFDCMVYPDPKFFIFKTKKQPHFFSEVRGCFFIDEISEN